MEHNVNFQGSILNLTQEQFSYITNLEIENTKLKEQVKKRNAYIKDLKEVCDNRLKDNNKYLNQLIEKQEYINSINKNK